MIRLNSDVRVYLATTPVDGRKAINGLSAFVIEEFEATLMDGSVFVLGEEWICSLSEAVGTR